MIHLTELTDKAFINLEPGLYLAEKESACGKTYLCSIIEKYRERGYPVSSYTYSNVNIFDIKNVLDINKFKLVFIDRYDMYKDMGYQEILDFVNQGGTVIIDCKEDCKLQGKCKICFIEITAPKRIEVN